MLAALGLVAAERRRDAQRSVLRAGNELAAEAVAGDVAELAAEARRELRATGRAVDGETWRRALAADVRALVAERRLDDARRELRTRLAIPV